jgi:hypothetical protein
MFSLRYWFLVLSRRRRRAIKDRKRAENVGVRRCAGESRPMKYSILFRFTFYISRLGCRLLRREVTFVLNSFSS